MHQLLTLNIRHHYINLDLSYLLSLLCSFFQYQPVFHQYDFHTHMKTTPVRTLFSGMLLMHFHVKKLPKPLWPFLQIPPLCDNLRLTYNLNLVQCYFIINNNHFVWPKPYFLFFQQLCKPTIQYNSTVPYEWSSSTFTPVERDECK